MGAEDEFELEENRIGFAPGEEIVPVQKVVVVLQPEFSKLRLQYNHDFLEANHFLSSREADSIFLQFEFILGAHGAHKF